MAPVWLLYLAAALIFLAVIMMVRFFLVSVIGKKLAARRNVSK
jgi:hypothetical protein